MGKQEKGITLIALVVTIVVLLILAAVSISMLAGENGIITQAQKAKLENRGATVEEEKNIWKSNQKTDEYTEIESSQNLEELLEDLTNRKLLTEEEKKIIEETGKVTIGSKEIIFREMTIDEKIKVGDYVNYKTIEKTYQVDGNKAGSGTSNILKTEEIKWRYLGKDDNGKMLLVSEYATEGTIHLKKVNGYNYGVDILDEACEILYTNESMGKARNLKIEDIERDFTEETLQYVHSYTNSFDVTYGKTYEYTNINKLQYPNIYKDEIGGIIDNVSTSGKLGLSDKNIYDIGGKLSAQNSLIVKMTNWWYNKSWSGNIFKEPKSYELYIQAARNGEYYLSSRCVEPVSTRACFSIRYVYSGGVSHTAMFYSDGNYSNTIYGYALRPVIELKDNIEIDTSQYDSGKDENGVWQIK